MPDVLTLVIAVYNEADTLPLLQPRIARCSTACARIASTAASCTSTTAAPMPAGGCCATSPSRDRRVSLLRLSRNFGKEAALTAGLDLVEEGAALILDADGQDPPELIPQFVAKWREGFDDVYGTRTLREGEGWIKKSTAHGFYRLIGWLSKTPIPEDTGDFRLLSPRALAALRQLRERHRFMKGLFGWIGFRQVLDSVPARAAAGRQQQVQLLEAVELRARGHHQLQHRAAAPGDLSRRGHRVARVRVRVVDRGQGAAVGRSRSPAGRR